MSNLFYTEINGSGSGPQNGSWDWDDTMEEQVNNMSTRLDEGDILQCFLDPAAAGTLVIESFKLTRISDEMP